MMLQLSMQSISQYSGIDNDAFSGLQNSGIDNGTSAEYMESDIPDRYNTLDIDSSLLDQFDNDNIIELGLKDQINKDPLPY